MNYLHYEFDLEKHDVVEVTLDKRANVLLLDDANYSNLQAWPTSRLSWRLCKDLAGSLDPAA